MRLVVFAGLHLDGETHPVFFDQEIHFGGTILRIEIIEREPFGCEFLCDKVLLDGAEIDVGFAA